MEVMPWVCGRTSGGYSQIFKIMEINEEKKKYIHNIKNIYIYIYIFI